MANYTSDDLKKLLEEYNQATGEVDPGMAQSLPDRSGVDFTPPAPPSPSPTSTGELDMKSAAAQILASHPLGGTTPTPSIASDYGKGLDDAALAAAQKKAQQDAGYAMLAAGASKIGHSLAGLGQQHFSDFKDEFTPEYLKTVDQPVKNIIERRKAKDEALARQAKLMDISNDKAMQDPNSPISAALRDASKLVGLSVPDNVSGAQLKASGINLGTLLNAHQMAEARKASLQESSAQREAGREESKRKFAQQEVRNYQKDAEKEVKELRDQAIASKNLVAMTEEAKHNPIAASSIGVMAAKARGERGALSATDVTRYIENKSAATKVAQWINSASTGTIIPQNAEFIKDVERALQGMYDQRIGESYNRHAERFSQNTGLSPEESISKIVPQSEQSYINNLTVKVQLPDGRTGTIPRSKLQKAIEQGAKVIQ